MALKHDTSILPSLNHISQFKPSNQSRTAYPDDILPPPYIPPPNSSHSDCKLCYWLREQWLTAVEQGRDCFRLCHMTHTFLAEEREPGQVTLPSVFGWNVKKFEWFDKRCLIWVMWCVSLSEVCFQSDIMLERCWTICCCFRRWSFVLFCFVCQSLSRGK